MSWLEAPLVRSAADQIPGFIAGLASSAVGWGLARLGDGLRGRRRRKDTQASEDAWRRVHQAAAPLRLVQSPWSRGRTGFEPGEVLIDLAATHVCPDDVIEAILTPLQSQWTAAGHRDNEQVGVASIDVVREREEAGGSGVAAHTLRISAKRIRYFEFLATNNFAAPAGSRADAVLRGYRSALPATQPELSPIQEFANPLSVGLSIFCESGAQLVLATRTTRASSGGHIAPGMIFNPVGETTNPRDAVPDVSDTPRISPWATARRALHEEMGWEREHIESCDLLLHTFAWDEMRADYKFFGAVTTPLARAKLYDLWLNAPDRHEAAELHFHEASRREDVDWILRYVRRSRSAWAPEATMCTLRSLLAVGRAAPGQVERIFRE